MNSQPSPAARRYDDVDWDLKRPCADCPFRRGTPFHEGIANGTVDVVHSIELRRFAHTCHKTDNFSDSPEGRRYRGRLKHCAGSLIMLLKTGHGLDLQVPFLKAAEAGKLDIHELSEIARAGRRLLYAAGIPGRSGSRLGRLVDPANPSGKKAGPRGVRKTRARNPPRFSSQFPHPGSIRKFSP